MELYVVSKNKCFSERMVQFIKNYNFYSGNTTEQPPITDQTTDWTSTTYWEEFSEPRNYKLLILTLTLWRFSLTLLFLNIKLI